MSVVPFRPFHACMNSNAVTLLSCGGAAVCTDDDELLADALTDATELSSGRDGGAVTRSADATTQYNAHKISKAPLYAIDQEC